MKKFAFTLTEILLAIAIVGVIAAILLPIIITKYQNKAFDLAFDREVQTIQDLVDGLAVSEHAGNFHNTRMYLDSADENTDYNDSAGYFLKKYFRVTKYCGNKPGDCFANKYINYEERNKVEFDINDKLENKSACALLKNGMSVCITPQIGDKPIHGYIDLNGIKGPNTSNRDLRSFILGNNNKITVANETKPIANYCKDYPDAEVCQEPLPPVCIDEPPSPYHECCNPALHPDSIWIGTNACTTPTCITEPQSPNDECCNPALHPDSRWIGTYACTTPTLKVTTLICTDARADSRCPDLAQCYICHIEGPDNIGLSYISTTCMGNSCDEFDETEEIRHFTTTKTFYNFSGWGMKEVWCFNSSIGEEIMISEGYMNNPSLFNNCRFEHE